MNSYMITLISAAVLSALVTILSPEKWRKYINIISGIMIVSVIASPLLQYKEVRLFVEETGISDIDRYAQQVAVAEELKNRVQEDVLERIYNELKIKINAEVIIDVNENKEICGVREIKIWTQTHQKKIEKILKEVYSPKKITFH